jgi:hypothetical protein
MGIQGAHRGEITEIPCESTSRVVVLADTPNLFKSTRESFGADFQPDYVELFTMAKSRGGEIRAFAFVNDGFPKRRAGTLRSSGFTVLPSEGRDCDFRIVDQAVSMHRYGHIFILCSGDHRFAAISSMLRMLGKYVIVAALRQSCSSLLMHSADEFIPFPVLHCSAIGVRTAA